MKTRRWGRIAGIALLGVLALSAVGYLFRPDTTSSNGLEAIQLPAAEDGADSVLSEIDRALGREPVFDQARSVSGSTAPPIAVQPKPPELGQGTAAREVAPVAGADGAPATQNQPVSSIEERKIVRTASLKLQVKDVASSFDEVSSIAIAAGGFVAGSNFANVGEQQVGSVTVRVPAERYEEVLRELRALGVKVDSETSNASDVSEEYSDLTARLRTLEATQDQLLQLLARAQNVGDVLQVQDRLNNVQAEIERIKGRMALLDRLGNMATINVQLRPVVGAATSGEKVDFGAEIRKAWEDSLEFLAGIAAGVVTVIVFAWWLPLVAIPLVLGLRWLRGRPKPLNAVD